jgi:hypothetical protein
MGRISRSFQLVGHSYRILMQDKELMVLPLISGAITIAVVASFSLGFGVDAARVQRHGPDVYLPIFLTYVAAYAVGIFFQAAVIAGATERMRGGNPTIGSALSAAGRRAGPILMWAIVAATVGTLLRLIRDRVGFVGKIVAGIAGAAWSLATFFVVPVIVLEDRSIGESFSRSVSVFKQTWGETVVGSTSLGVAAFCAWLTLVALTGLVAWGVGSAVLAIAVMVIGAILLTVFFSALQGVYVASLYRYATSAGESASGFEPTLLAEAFVPRERR